MPKLVVRVLREMPEGVEVGSEPCSCDRFFVIGPEAEDRARKLAAERRGIDAYVFERRELRLPWGESTSLIIGDFRR